MNWGKTKTIFIICFFLLDVFLGYKLYQRQVNYKLENISTQSVKDLKAKDIKIDGTLPSAKQNIIFITGKKISFVDSNGNLIAPIKTYTRDLNNKVIQTISPNSDGTIISSVFKKPINVPKTKDDRTNFLTQYIYNGKDYQYWFTKNNHLIFVQVFNGRPVYTTISNQTGALVVDINSKGKISGYEQTYLNLTTSDTSNSNQTLDIVTPTAAINNLWKANDITSFSNATIKHVDLGYFNLIGGTSNNNLLVFVPAWHVIVNSDKKTKDFFVNAVYGYVFPLEETE